MAERTPMLGSELRALRERRGLSLREAAELAGLSPEGLGGIERGGRYPSLRTLERLAEVLRCRIVITPHETIVEDE